MENSCRKKYKPSPKKWILASRCAGFRRNSALVPANAGLFHYAGNNPVRYIDPDGRDIVTPGMAPEAKRRFDIAINELKKIDFAKNIITEIENTQEFTLTVIHNNSGINTYSDGVVYWDSNKNLYNDFHVSDDGKIIYDDCIDSITLLFHEISHGYQDWKKELKSNPTKLEKEMDEDKCIEKYEHPVAKARGNYLRKNHREFMIRRQFTIPEFLPEEGK